MATTVGCQHTNARHKVYTAYVRSDKPDSRNGIVDGYNLVKQANMNEKTCYDICARCSLVRQRAPFCYFIPASNECRTESDKVYKRNQVLTHATRVAQLFMLPLPSQL